MTSAPLTDRELDMLRAVFRRHPEVAFATLFGSRAKGTHNNRSDVDLAVGGDVAPLRAEAIAAELEELPLPYRFEVQSLSHIHYRPLLSHIERVGLTIYSANRVEESALPSSSVESSGASHIKCSDSTRISE